MRESQGSPSSSPPPLGGRYEQGCADRSRSAGPSSVCPLNLLLGRRYDIQLHKEKMSLFNRQTLLLVLFISYLRVVDAVLEHDFYERKFFGINQACGDGIDHRVQQCPENAEELAIMW
jgi:hypothetical protein